MCGWQRGELRPPPLPAPSTQCRKPVAQGVKAAGRKSRQRKEACHRSSGGRREQKWGHTGLTRPLSSLCGGSNAGEPCLLQQLTSGFLSLSPSDAWGRVALHRGPVLGVRGTFQSIPGLHPLEAGSSPLPAPRKDNPNLQTWLNVPGGNIRPRQASLTEMYEGRRGAGGPGAEGWANEWHKSWTQGVRADRVEVGGNGGGKGQEHVVSGGVG